LSEKKNISALSALIINKLPNNSAEAIGQMFLYTSVYLQVFRVCGEQVWGFQPQHRPGMAAS